MSKLKTNRLPRVTSQQCTVIVIKVFVGSTGLIMSASGRQTTAIIGVKSGSHTFSETKVVFSLS